MKNIDLTPIIEALIALLSAVITIVILPKVRAYLTEKLSNEKRENLKKWIRIAVAAAEQMYNGSGLGQDKYRYVVSFLEDKGIYVNYKEVEALIESEVHKLTKESGYFIAVPEGGTALTEDTEPDTADEECELATAEAVG